MKKKNQKAILYAVFNLQYLVFGIEFKEIKLIASQERKGARLHTCTHAIQAARICPYTFQNTNNCGQTGF